MWLVAAALASIAIAGHSQSTPTPTAAPVVFAPGWQPLSFPAPQPGSYALPPLGDAADGVVLDSAGTARRLHEVFGDKVVVLSFIYTSCPDVNACPMAAYVLSGLQRKMLEHPERRDDVRLVTMSFDPASDRPEVMKEYGRQLQRAGSDWQFVTADSAESLSPILASYGQSVQREYGRDGTPRRTFSHILRVFLIDSEKHIRNIYTTSFLHADTVWSDIETLLQERPGPARGGLAVEVGTGLRGPGDQKNGYERSDYETRSRRLDARPARVADLESFVKQPPLGLPEIPLPPDNRITSEKIALGRKLFFDRRLSGNGTISCAMCHVPEQGFTSNELATAIGIEGRTVRRNAPTIYNVAFADPIFHDGREDRLEQQVWAPLLAANEMGNPSIGSVLAHARTLPDYSGLFEAAFDGRGPTMETVGMALASYERTLVSANSPFDRWHYGKREDAISDAARRGFRLFVGKAGCAACHRVGQESALLTDQQLHNTGIGYRQAMQRPAGEQRIQVAPGTFLAIDPAVVADASERPPSDLGRYEVTGDPDDRWKYKTPTLRNVALTAPYMHNGSLGTLREVIQFYNAGGIPNELLDPRIKPLGLSDAEVNDLVAFLESLTGDNVGAIVADACAVPIGDPG